MAMDALFWVEEAHNFIRRQAQAQIMGVPSLLSSSVFLEEGEMHFQHLPVLHWPYPTCEQLQICLEIYSFFLKI